jgi:amino acid transporter
LVNGFDVFWPGRWDTARFVTAYAGIPAFLVIYLVHRTCWAKGQAWALKSEDVDLVTGMEEMLADEKTSMEKGDRYRYRWWILGRIWQ